MTVKNMIAHCVRGYMPSIPATMPATAATIIDRKPRGLYRAAGPPAWADADNGYALLLAWLRDSVGQCSGALVTVILASVNSPPWQVPCDLPRASLLDCPQNPDCAKLRPQIGQVRPGVLSGRPSKR